MLTNDKDLLFTLWTLDLDDLPAAPADALLPSADWLALMSDRLADISQPLEPLANAA